MNQSTFITPTPTPSALFGTPGNDLSLAAIGGMVSSLLVLLYDIAPLPPFLFLVLVPAGQGLLYWGFHQVGRFYHLKWVLRGARLMLLGLLMSWVSSLTGWSLANWVFKFAFWVSPFLVFVDLWPMRQLTNRPLATALVISQIAFNAGNHLKFVSPDWTGFWEACTTALTAWFLYDVAERFSRTHPAN
ncbi:hypothetical protein [Larkinella terrae]|uniref:Uncharacterized protein n=1 Tax=Larkinella terrae TaxID=2025311 RepID=A0A7K0EEZ9_9BACT|nr:hypothetical protein [Larkinella terrae]MRS60325.1 hypothetical protein [Larkinella terrae]